MKPVVWPGWMMGSISFFMGRQQPVQIKQHQHRFILLTSVKNQFWKSTMTSQTSIAHMMNLIGEKTCQIQKIC